jgi:hypothetical protein
MKPPNRESHRSVAGGGVEFRDSSRVPHVAALKNFSRPQIRLIPHNCSENRAVDPPEMQLRLNVWRYDRGMHQISVQRREVIRLSVSSSCAPAIAIK